MGDTSYPIDMDQECVRICNALNALPDINTISSCCGHNKQPFRVFFTAHTIEALRPILRCVVNSGWSVECYWADGSDVIYFMLEGVRDLRCGDIFATWLLEDHAHD
jgi:hypothetical protein